MTCSQEGLLFCSIKDYNDYKHLCSTFKTKVNRYMNKDCTHMKDTQYIYKGNLQKQIVALMSKHARCICICMCAYLSTYTIYDRARADICAYIQINV